MRIKTDITNIFQPRKVLKQSLKETLRKISFKKGVVASYQAALSEEYTPLERVKPVLTWSRGCPGLNKMVSDDQKPGRFHKV